MRLKKKETTRALFILVMLIGAFQLIHLFSYIDSSISREDTQSGSDSNYRALMVRSTELSRQGIIPSSKCVFGTEIKENDTTVQSTTVIAALFTDNTRDALPLPFHSSHQFIPPLCDPILYGHRRNRKGFLTIGIPSIRRPNTENIYLYQTLESLINNTNEEEKREITVVVLLSDRNETYNDKIAREMHIRFRKFLQEGFIRVIKAPKVIYLDVDKLNRTTSDNIERVKWRAKQNIDFAYLCSYSKNISDYYIQLEDDVLTARNFLTYIRDQIYNVTASWFMLEFSRLGFIAKLFKDEDLEWVATFLLKNFEKAPGDLLLGKMLSLRGQKHPIYSQFSLFQHNGKFSSLRNKMMPSIDSKFKDADKVKLAIMNLPKGKNPRAKFITSFERVPGYFPYFAYDNNSSTFFWAKRPHKNDYLSLLFESAQNFTRIIVSTGDSKRKHDSLSHSALFAGVKLTSRLNVNQQGRCGSYIRLTDFIDGEIDTKAMGITIPNDIICLKIQLYRHSKTWVIIRDIVLI